MAKTRGPSIQTELLRESREAALNAVQAFNNPRATFKTETFIVLMVIAWTRLLHAYYRGKDIEYRYQIPVTVTADQDMHISQFVIERGAEGAMVWTSEILDCFNVSLLCPKMMSFRPACDIHDRCYETAYSNKTLCDLQYFFELNHLCQSSGLGVDEFIICTGQATIYAALVVLAGGEAYAEGQVKACRCEDHEEDGFLTSKNAFITQ